MSLKDLTQDLENFIWTDTTKIGNKSNPQSFTDGNGSIVSGKKSFDRPSKSALEGMESIFGPKYSNVGTRGSYTSVDYMDGTKQGRGFTPPGGPPKGFTIDMGKSEYVIGTEGYTLTPLSHTIAQMNSSLSYGVVPEQTINDIPIAPGAWGDYNIPLSNYISKLDVISNLSSYDSEYNRTLAYIPNISEPELPIFKQFMRGSSGLNRFDLTSPNFDGFSFTEDTPYVLPQTIFSGPVTSPFVPNLFDNTPKLEHAHSDNSISRLVGYPGLYVGSQGDINETIPQPLYSTPDYGVFTGPVDAFDHTEVRSKLYDVYQHHFQPTDINFTNVPLGTDLFGENESWRVGSIHIGSQDVIGAVGGGVSYYGNLNTIIPRGSIYNTQIYSSGQGGGQYRVPQAGVNTLPPGGISNIPEFDGVQTTLLNIYNPQNLSSPFSIINQPAGYSYDSPQIPNAHGSSFMTTPIWNSVSQWNDVDVQSQTHTVDMINLTGPTSQVYQSTFNTDDSTGNLVSYTPLAHGSDFTTIPINAQSSIFANQSQFLKYTVHEHGFPGITMKTMGESGNIIDGTPPTRDEVMYTTGTTTKAIFGGPIFNAEDDNIFKKFIDSDNSIRRIELNSPNYDPDGNNFFTHLDRVPYNLSGDGQYHQRAPFILRDIGQRWGIDDGTNIDAGFIRGGVVTSAERTALDIVRIGKFLTTSKGITFLAKQAGLQLLNPRPETRLWNPLSIVGSLPPTMHIERHWSGFTQGLGSGRYGSFDNPLGQEAFYDNKKDLGAAFGLIDEKLEHWGYGQPENNGFGKIFASAEDKVSLTWPNKSQNRLTNLTYNFIAAKRDNTPSGDSLFGFTSFFPEEGAFGRTPAVPTQYVFSQYGPFGKDPAFRKRTSGREEDTRSSDFIDNRGVPYSLAQYKGKAGKPYWVEFGRHIHTGDVEYRSARYDELDHDFGYLNSFRSHENMTGLGIGSSHSNARLNTDYFSPLIQFSWRFMVKSNPIKGGREEYGGWAGDTAEHTFIRDEKPDSGDFGYTQKSFTSDPSSPIQDKGNLVKQYSLMAYGDIGPANKYEDSPILHNTLELKQVEDLGVEELKTLQSEKVRAKMAANAALRDIPAQPGVARENIGSSIESQEWGDYDASITKSKQKQKIYEEAAKKYEDAKDLHDKLVATTMAKLANSSKKAVSDVGDQSIKGNTAVPSPDLGMINKFNNNYKGLNTDKVNMIPYGDDYGDTEDFIKFKFKDIVNNKFIIFRALLSGISDTVTPEWEATRFIGRPDDVHVYKGTSRKISFTFDIYPKTKQEFPVLLEKLNFLVGLNYPSFKNNKMVAPFIELTLGDMFNATPGYIDGVTVTPQENSTWEMDDGLQFPKHIQVGCDFTYIGKYMPSSLGKHYELNWLKDQGWATSKDGQTSTAGTFVLGENGLTTSPDARPARYRTIATDGLFSEIQPNPSTES